MRKFKIIPLSTDVAEKIRVSMKDDFGHALSYKTISGRALCRYCLGDGEPHHQHILFSYMPFEENKNPYSEIGPVYIHDKCKQYAAANVFPTDLGKRKYLQGRGYDSSQNLIAGDLVEGQKVEDMIDRMFEDPRVDYLHIRDGMTGCYFLKIERA